MDTMTMTELRLTGRILNVKGTTSYVKYTKKNKHVLLQDIRQRLELPAIEIVLIGKPSMFLRNEIRRKGIQVSSDVGEPFRMGLIKTLVASGWVANTTELFKVQRLVDLLREQSLHTATDDKTIPAVTTKSAVK